MKYMTINNELNVNENYVNFPYPIRDVKVINNTLIVLLDIPQNDNTVDNLYAVNDNGAVIWHVQHLKEVYPAEKMLPYEQIIVRKQEICAIDFYGRCYFIDPNNGKILRRIIYK